MSKPLRLGMMTPSSNTILEPVTAALLRDVPHITAHFSRFRVTQITLEETGLGQFVPEKMLPAAELLADAKMDSIAWNGTSASWLGVERDAALCDAITAKTGISATSSTLAYHEAFRRSGAKKIGLVTPYTDDVRQQILSVWGKAGFDCSNGSHLALSDNFSFAEVTETKIAEMIREVAARGCDAIAILCTNMNGARVCADLEPELGIPLVDSVSVTLWHSIENAGGDARAVKNWGRIFQDRQYAGG